MSLMYPKLWHAISLQEVVRAFVTDLDRGLTNEEADSGLAHSGANALAEQDEEPWWKEVLESLTEPLQLLLIAVAGVYFWLGETGCWRRSKFDPPCRLNFDPGLGAGIG